MNTLPRLVVPVLALALAAACADAPADRQPEASAAADTGSAPAAADLHADGHGAADHGAAGAEGGQALLPIMRELANQVAALTAALWLEDYHGMAGPAAAIAGHTRISAEEQARIERVLGPEQAAFAAADAAVHESALQLEAAVKAQDRAAILQRLADLQAGCVACHAQYRAALRTPVDAPSPP